MSSENTLRTLKDIGIKEKATGRKPNLIKIYDLDLKVEAVKWIKDLEKRTCFTTDLPPCKISTIALKHFMNITEEDLK